MGHTHQAVRGQQECDFFLGGLAKFPHRKASWNIEGVEPDNQEGPGL